MPQPTAMVIEPDPKLRIQYRDQLAPRWTVYTAANAYLAIPQLREHQPDVVITEAQLAFVSGTEVCEILKDRYPYVRVIVMATDPACLSAAVRAGADAALTKPIDPSDLEEVAERLLRPSDHASLS